MEKNKEDITRLVLTVKPGKEWINFDLPDGQKIRILMRECDGRNSLRASIDCPRSININRTKYEESGNN